MIDPEAELINNVARAIEALEAHRNKEGRWWRYFVSHRTFELVVGDALGRGGNVLLRFSGCEYIGGPIRWPNQQLELTWQCDLDNRESWRYTLKDNNVGFHLEAHVLSWHQNLDLVHKSHLRNDGGEDYSA